MQRPSAQYYNKIDIACNILVFVKSYPFIDDTAAPVPPITRYICNLDQTVLQVFSALPFRVTLTRVYGSVPLAGRLKQI
jgi:hypothetical protein